MWPLHLLFLGHLILCGSGSTVYSKAPLVCSDRQQGTTRSPYVVALIHFLLAHFLPALPSQQAVALSEGKHRGSCTGSSSSLLMSVLLTGGGRRERNGGSGGCAIISGNVY